MDRLLFIPFCLSISLTLCDAAIAETPETDAEISECMRIHEGLSYVLTDNPSILSSFETVIQLDAERRSLEAKGKTQIQSFGRFGTGYNALQSAQVDNQYGLEISRKLYDGGYSKATLESAKYREKASTQNFKAVKQNITEEFLFNIILITHFEEMAGLLSSHSKDLETRLKIAVSQLDSGTITTLDYYRLRTRLSMTSLEVKTAEIEVKQALQNLSRLTGDQFVCVDGNQIDLFLKQYQFTDREIHLEQAEFLPIVREAEDLLAAARFDWEAARRSWRPSVSASAYTSQTYSQFTEEYEGRDRLGVEFSVPLYDSGVRKQALAGVAARKRQLEHDLRRIRETVLGERRIAWDVSELTRESIDIARSAQDSAEKNYAGVAYKYDLSLATLDDLLIAKQSVLESKLTHLNLKTKLRNVSLELLDYECLTELSDQPLGDPLSTLCTR